MGVMVDDSVKQKLLDSLAEEPIMVLLTAYAYAKNYVNYGEDITKEWTTAVQQASIIQQVRIKAQAEAYDSFKADYETRLKADMVAMLTDIQLEIEELDSRAGYDGGGMPTFSTDYIRKKKVNELVQQKINALEGNEDGGNNN